MDGLDDQTNQDDVAVLAIRRSHNLRDPLFQLIPRLVEMPRTRGRQRMTGLGSWPVVPRSDEGTGHHRLP